MPQTPSRVKVSGRSGGAGTRSGVDKSARLGKGRRRSRWKLKVGVRQEGVPGGIPAPLEPLSTLSFPGNREADVEAGLGLRAGL